MAIFEIPQQPDPTKVASDESSSELKRCTKTYICVKTIDLETFIKKATGWDFKIRPSEKGTPRIVSAHYATIYQGMWQDFKNNRCIPSLEALLNGLCSEGLIPAGRYIIEDNT